MSDKVAEIRAFMMQDNEAAWVSNLWDTYNNQRMPKIQEWQELRNYIFATDTSTTSNSTLPWKNSTTLPKLCQIRDNLHSNYLSALFPNDDWLRWEGYATDDSLKDKVAAIESYMKNKVREGHFRTEMSKLLYDYIDYGNAFVTVDYEANYREEEDGTKTPGFIGPKARRISPLDVVFNPLAPTFVDSFKIIRSITTIGELVKQSQDEPEQSYLKDAIANRLDVRSRMGGYKVDDFNKAVAYQVDGFGNIQEYFGSDYVELLEFYGDYFNPETGELRRNQIITVMDRSKVMRVENIPSWMGHAPIYHVGWRLRPDNLWAMGPLDNLVGMQYRIDHLENATADAWDLSIHPPLVIKGEVEEFTWGPNAEIHIDENGGVTELGKNLGPIIAAQNMVQALEDRMEIYAGAPREAMGIRTPGEKTAFEVQTLDNASGRIFQEKITTFEIEALEPCLNTMLEKAKRNIDGFDVVRVLDTDIGVTAFMKVTKEDITATGKLRPIGARHFATQAQLLQNLTSLFNSQLAEKVAPHTSGQKLASLVEDVMGLERFGLFSPNVAIFENQETQRLANQAQEDLEVEQAQPVAEEG